MEDSPGHRGGNPESLGDKILVLVEDESGKIWAGAYGDGVSFRDGLAWSALQK